MKTNKKILLGISGILLLTGCHDIPFFTQYKSVDAKGWESRDTLVYKLPEVKSASTYDMKVAIRAVRGYRYGNLVLAARLYEGKKLITTDTIPYNMYDTNGEQTGTGFPFVEQEVSLKHPVTLLPHKKYRVKITHIMRLDPLDGVCNVGITVF